MALSLKVTPDKKGVYLKIGKVITGEEFVQVNKIIYGKDENVKKQLFYVLDLSDSESASVSEEDKTTILEQLAIAVGINNQVYVGVIAPNDLIFGLVRMWIGSFQPSVFISEVFKEKQETISWLKEKTQSKWLEDEYWPFV